MKVPAAADGAADAVMVNGLSDASWDGLSRARGVGMGQARENVRRLRQRIFKAAWEGDLKRVRNLQKLMLRSHSNTLVSVERVTEVNAGRRTPGVDGEVALTDQARTELIARVQREARSWTPLPVRRVYIPKAGTTIKRRPLGIPVIFDRVLQARAKNALEAEWEARFEARSYGFRPGRGCHDAIEAVFNALSGKNAKRLWILDADLTAAFDRIDHSQLMTALGSFPARDLVQGWLRAGVIEAGTGFAPTQEGSPQGGVISPVLMNVALHGLEEAAGVRYYTHGSEAGWTVDGTPVLCRYADDFIVACHSQEQAAKVTAQLSQWLKARGLALNEDKTRIVHACQGFDFLGFNIRRYPNGKLIIKPSAAAVRRIRSRLREVFHAMRGTSASALIWKLNPIISGWASYYRTAVSSATFNALDDYVWKLAYKWAIRRHRTKPRKWIAARYFGRFHPARGDMWVFGDRDSGAYLQKFAWTKIVRHQLVTGRASPDDPTLADYWARRRRRHTPPLSDHIVRLLRKQAARCPLCGDHLLHADNEPSHPHEWEQWHKTVRKAITKQALETATTGRAGTSDKDRIRLIHTHCRRRLPSGPGSQPALLPTTPPSRLA
ncbi:group II intron reverse transcriptase/maturase [Nonomuraea sp. NPDC048916]|uniref:group II intron reverse transcriptase/maturase n=1 Tax=Nonomuraea sp. NPDC048916 TaxID=3154232 RepID=UPI0033D60AFC